MTTPDLSLFVSCFASGLVMCPELSVLWMLGKHFTTEHSPCPWQSLFLFLLFSLQMSSDCPSGHLAFVYVFAYVAWLTDYLYDSNSKHRKAAFHVKTGSLTIFPCITHSVARFSCLIFGILLMVVLLSVRMQHLLVEGNLFEEVCVCLCVLSLFSVCLSSFSS